MGGGTAGLSAGTAHASTVTVQSGDTVSKIAADHGVSIDTIDKDNNLNSDSTIYSGQQLNVNDNNDSSNTYTVQSGDTVSEIATSHSLDTEKILTLNNLSWSNSTIYVGEQIKLSDDNNSQNVQSSTNQSQSSQAQNTQANSSISQQAVNLALQYSKMNIPYVWGGKTPAGFDCSGLTHYVYQQLGKEIGLNTTAQEQHVTDKPVSQANPGDLLFWGTPGNTYHVALYIGNNQYVAAPNEGQDVEVENISSYFMPSFAGSVK